MNEIDDGGPAFPADLRLVAHETSGMSLRDWFAGHAPVKIEAWQMVDVELRIQAARAYRWADAMLKARGER